MRRIAKSNPPEFWTSYVQKHRSITYHKLSDSEEGRKRMRELRESLLCEQKFLCAYCCKEISIDQSHNEHIRPKDQYQKDSMCYENIVASCETKGAQSTCGHSKQREFDEHLFVSPLQEDCETHFRFFPSGKIEGTTEQGQYTVDLLNLNAYSLRQARRVLFEQCRSGLKGDAEYIQWYLSEEEGKLRAFVDMVEYFERTGEFE